MIDYGEVRAAIERLRHQGSDDAHCEAKACVQRLSADLWESVSAFANTHGGLILLGLDEREGFAPCPAFRVTPIIDQFVEGIGDGSPTGARLTNPPRYEVERIMVEETTILAVRIIENDLDRKPCYIRARGVASGSFKRVDDKDLLLSRAEIFELENAGTPQDADRNAVPETGEEDLDADAIERYLSAMASTKALRGISDRTAALERLGITTKQGTVRLAGLITLGAYPQQHLPSLVIDVAHHPGYEKAEPGQPRFLDRTVCDGNLPEAIADAVRAVLRNLRVISYVEGVGRHDVPELPEEVLREAIVNAVAHREYHGMFLGQAVSVDIYRNRVEITSPGGLWGGKTLDNLADGTSRCRNSALMHLLETLPASENGTLHAERQGSGIRFMINAMRAQGLADPEFHASIDQFKVILWRPGIDEAPLSPRGAKCPAAARSGNVPRQPSHRPVFIAPDAPGGSLALETHTDIEFDGSTRRKERLESNLDFVKDNAPASINEISEELDINVATIRRDMRSLLEAGYIRATAPAQSKRRRYLLA